MLCFLRHNNLREKRRGYLSHILENNFLYPPTPLISKLLLALKTDKISYITIPRPVAIILRSYFLKPLNSYLLLSLA